MTSSCNGIWTVDIQRCLPIKILFVSIVTKITFYEIKFIAWLLLLEKMEDPPTHHLNSFLPPLILLFISNYTTTAGLHLFISHPFWFILPVADKNFAFAVSFEVSLPRSGLPMRSFWVQLAKGKGVLSLW